ncbi:MAG TPA: ABC transporter ATP-binding protein [bacterium]|nr:ABC transporter ATP-binding protein [bacterium]
MNELIKIEGLHLDLLGPPGGTRGRILRGIDLSMMEGEKLALVGESGCGKSMIALSILNLIPRPPMVQSGGRILFKGEGLDGFNEDQWRDLRGKRIGIVFQEPLSSLNPVLTVGDQLVEGLIAHHQAGPEEARTKALGLLREVGLPDPDRIFGHYPHQLSGGMCQRVMIAMAVSCKPELLIADEPTTALDVTVQAQILDLLAQMTRVHRMAVLLITHDLRIARDFSDRVAILYCGKVVEMGPAKVLFERPAHPYTQGLLDAIPKVDKTGEELGWIPGTLPSPYDSLTGCAFAERCPRADERCRKTEPGWIEVEKGHSALCFYPSKG